MNISEYYKDQFVKDLKHLKTSPPKLFGKVNDVITNALDEPDVSFFGGQQWASFNEDIKGIPEENCIQFISCLFMITLLDQAIYKCHHRKYKEWRANNSYPKFGWCGLGPHHEKIYCILDIADSKYPNFHANFLLIVHALIDLIGQELDVYHISQNEFYTGLELDRDFTNGIGKSFSALKACLQEQYNV